MWNLKIYQVEHTPSSIQAKGRYIFLIKHGPLNNKLPVGKAL